MLQEIWDAILNFISLLQEDDIPRWVLLMFVLLMGLFIYLKYNQRFQSHDTANPFKGMRNIIKESSISKLVVVTIIVALGITTACYFIMMLVFPLMLLSQ